MSSTLQTTLFGHTLQSPLILGSGPISYGAEGILRAHKAGIGAVVTKTIRDSRADNPYPHIAFGGSGSMINAEKWTDLPARQWVEREIPEAKAGGAVLIASIGHTPQEAEHWVGPVDRAGADMIELVSYMREAIAPMTGKAKEQTDKPVIVKLSPNWPDPLQAAKEVLNAGADAITAMDSIGPVLRINIRSARPMLGGENGYGWLTGSAIRPLVLRFVAEIAALTDKPLIGIGGVMRPEDAVEMLMAGATHVGVCSAPILKGVEYIAALNAGILGLLDELGYASLSEASGAALANLPKEEVHRKYSFHFERDLCTACRRCVQVCPYQARALDEEKNMELDEELCRYCGLCVTVCNPMALTGGNL